MLSLNDKGTRQLLQGCSLYSDNCIRHDAASTSRKPNVLSSLAAVETDNRSGSSSSLGLTCVLCNAIFPNRQAQTEHVRLDWHRFNLRQQLAGRPPVTEDLFDEIALGDGVSSISGSDNESDPDDLLPYTKKLPIAGAPEQDSEEDDEMERRARAGNKVMLEVNGSVYSLYRALVNPHKVSYDNAQLKRAVDGLVAAPVKTVIIMLSAGHFAGAVFDGSTVVIHKTFHRYVVRAKRGTAQSVHDAQGKNAKSAGANLRRYNEAALKVDVVSLFQQWLEHIADASLIFLRVPLYQRSIFFGGKTPLLEKGCRRVRTIPFPTRRPTFKEVQRVHTNLFSLTCHGLVADFRDSIRAAIPARVEPVAAAASQAGGSCNADSTSSPVLSRSGASSPAAPSRRERHRRENPRHQQLPAEFAAALAADLEAEPAAEGEGDDADVDLSWPLASCHATVDMDDMLSQLQVDFGDGRPAVRSSLLVADGKASKKRQRGGKTKKSSPGVSDTTEPDESVVFGDQLLAACRSGNAVVLRSLLMQSASCPAAAPAAAAAAAAAATAVGDVATLAGSTENVEVAAGIHQQRHCVAMDQSHADSQSASQHTHSRASEASHVVACDNSGTNSATGTSDGSHPTSDPPDSVNVTESDGFNPKETRSSELGHDSACNGASPSPSGSTARPVPEFDVDTVLQSPSTQLLLNTAQGSGERHLLVVASESGRANVVQLLLECGADPLSRGRREAKAYAAASDKMTRDTFRRFRAEHPDRYDYQAAGVDAPLTDDAEEERQRKKAEKKKQQRQARQKKDKERKADAVRQEAEDQKKRDEAKEKQWLASLTDREKRALAAERRLQGQKLSSSNCCGMCSRSLDGLVPFTKFDLKYCSMDCVKVHQAKMVAK